MSLLAHSIGAAINGESARRIRHELDQKIRHETKEAKSIQKQTGCSWSEALRIAKDGA